MNFKKLVSLLSLLLLSILCTNAQTDPRIYEVIDAVSADRIEADITTLAGFAYEENGAVSEIITDIQVAYFAFVDKNKLLATVLSDDRLDLTMIDVKQQQTDTLLINAGRSIHKIPNTNAMSYTVKNEEDKFDVFQLDLKDMESYFICELPVGIQDYTWIDELRLLIGSNASLFVYDSFGKQSWEKVADLSEYMIENITRITVSPNGKQIALVAEPKE